MEADRMTNEEDVIDVPVGVQQLFDQRHHLNINRNVRKAQPKLFRAAVICAAILLMIVYFVMPVSRVSGITLSGNAFLSRDYILDLADLSNNSIYYLSLPFILERRIEKDPLIENAKVSLERDNSVKITVTERKILGYRYEDEPLILMADGSYVELKSTYLDIITKIPLILGFNTEEQTEKLCRSFADVDEKIIRDISEISQYSLSYDPEAIRVLMRSGGYFMGNFYNMGVLNRYWAIYNYQKDKSQCIFADDSMTSAYSKMCPWDEPVVNREYWTDDTGKVITNTYGDKVEKHYYTDADGNANSDTNGNTNSDADSEETNRNAGIDKVSFYSAEFICKNNIDHNKWYNKCKNRRYISDTNTLCGCCSCNHCNNHCIAKTEKINVVFLRSDRENP